MNGRICTKCNTFKSWEDFSRATQQKSGYRPDCKVCCYARNQKNYHADVAKQRERCKIKHQKYKDTTLRAWKKANKELLKAYKAFGKKILIQATPPWADLAAIKEFYKDCPTGYHVDHIIPLRGKDVNGLHVLENLQYLPSSINISKKNHIIPETLTVYPTCYIGVNQHG